MRFVNDSYIFGATQFLTEFPSANPEKFGFLDSNSSRVTHTFSNYIAPSLRVARLIFIHFCPHKFGGLLTIIHVRLLVYLGIKREADYSSKT